MNMALWMMQDLLAALFFMTGFTKVNISRQKHVDSGHLKTGASVVPLQVLGILEVLGCVGITVPWLTGIVPVLTPVAAACFCLVMAGALVIHTRKREYGLLLLPAVILTLAAVVAYYRFAFLRTIMN